MNARPKAGSKPYRSELRTELRALGFDEPRLAAELCEALMRECGLRPRQAWRLARELTLVEAAARYNQILDDPNAPMRAARIWDFEQWPARGVRPTLSTLRILAQVYGTSWDRLVDRRDLAEMPAAERDAYHREAGAASSGAVPPPAIAPDDARPAPEALTAETLAAHPLEPGMVERRADASAVIDAVLAAADRGTAGQVVAVTGAGGFGKTTLLAQVCHDVRIAGRFDHVLWVELGEQCGPARAVQLILDLCVRLAGTRPALADPEQAGSHFARVLGDRRVLLVVDNVWTAADLAPFLIGGPNTVRLATTRNAGALPAGAVRWRLGEMSDDQIKELLTANVPALWPRSATRLAAMCKGWPLLAAVVGAAVGQDLAAGASPGHAVHDAGRALEAGGPEAFDVWDGDQRRAAIGQAIASSLRSLQEHVRIDGGPGLRDRYLALAVFPAATPIPLQVLTIWWGRAYGWTPSAVRRFCRVLADRSLIDAYLADRDAVVLHDVFRDRLRRLIGDDWPALHRSLTDAHRATTDGSWTALDTRHSYLWRHLSHHLHEAGRTTELAELLSSPDYVVKKAAVFGHESLAADRAVAARAARPDLPAWRTALALTGTGYLLRGLAADHDIAATLLVASVRSAGRPTAVRRLRELANGRGFDVRWARAVPVQAGGHIGAVTSVAVHRDLVVSGGEDGVVRLWKTGGREPVRVHHGHTGWVCAVAVAPDGRSIASAGDDGTVRLWRAADGEPAGVLAWHDRAVRALAFAASNRLVSAGEDGRVLLWNTDDRALIREMPNGCPVWSLAVTPGDGAGPGDRDGERGGGWVATAGADRCLRLYDVATGARVHEIAAHGDWIRSVTFAGPTVVTGSGDHRVKLWNVSDEGVRHLRTIDTGSRVRAVAAPGPDRVITAGDDAVLREYSPGGRTAELVMPKPVDWVRALAVAPDGAVLAGCEDGGIRIWDGAGVKLLSRAGDATWSTAIAGGRALFGRADGTIDVRTLDGGDPVRGVRTGSGRICALAATADIAAAACGDGAVRVFMIGDSTGAGAGDSAAAGGHDAVLIFDSAVAEAGLPPGQRAGRAWAVALNRDGTRLAAAGAGGFVRVWELPSGRPLWRHRAHPARIRALAFDAAGGLLLTGGGEGTARLWRLPAGGRSAGEVADGPAADGPVAEFSGELGAAGSWIRTVAIDAAGTRIAYGCGHGDLHVHELTGAATTDPAGGSTADAHDRPHTVDLYGHSGRVLAAGFAADPDVLVSAAADGTVRAWSLPAGAQLAEVRVDCSLQCAAFDPVSGVVLTGGATGSAAVTPPAGTTPGGDVPARGDLGRR